MRRQAFVLMFGHDPTLLRFRAMVLETHVDRVTQSHSRESAIEILRTTHVDLLILCQTLSLAECKDLVAKAEADWPWTKVLVLRQTTPFGCTLGTGVATMAPLDGPVKLLIRVDGLLNSNRAPQ